MKPETPEALNAPARVSFEPGGKGSALAKSPFRLPTGSPRFKNRPARNAQAEHRLAQRLRVEEAKPLAEIYLRSTNSRLPLRDFNRGYISAKGLAPYTL